MARSDTVSMDILEKALAADRAGNNAACAKYLSQADQMALFDPATQKRVAAVKMITNYIYPAEFMSIVRTADPSSDGLSPEDVELIGWAAKMRLEFGPSDTKWIALQMLDHGARFKVLALVAQAEEGAVDGELLASTPPRAVERALQQVSEGPARATLLAASLRAGLFSERAAEAIDLAASHRGTSEALELSAELFETLRTDDVAKAAALAAMAAGMTDATRAWVSKCSPHVAAVLTAIDTPSATNWVKAVDALMTSGALGEDFVTAVSSAMAFGADQSLLRTWAQAVSFPEPHTALRFSQTLMANGCRDLVSDSLAAHTADPGCALALAEVSDEEAAVGLWRSVAKSEVATPDQISSATNNLADKGQRPVGPLIALVNYTDASVEQVALAAEKIAALIIAGDVAGRKAAESLIVAANKLPTDDLRAVRWLFAAAKSGHRAALGELKHRAGASKTGGWASLAIAEVAAVNKDTGEFIAAISDAHEVAEATKDTELSEAITACVNRSF